MFSHGQVLDAYDNLDKLGKRGLPTLDAILKTAELMTLMRPAAETASGIRLMEAARAEHFPSPITKQDIYKSPDLYQKALFDALSKPSKFKDPGIRLTPDDLPKLPEPSDDPEKQKKYLEARQELANIVANLGPLFTYSKKK